MQIYAVSKLPTNWLLKNGHIMNYLLVCFLLVSLPITLAGLPRAKTLAGISSVTTEPAPISELFPTVTGNITEPAPILEPCLIVVFNSFHSLLILGYFSLVNVT